MQETTPSGDSGALFRLSNKNIAAMPPAGVSLPTYDRGAVRSGILHIGAGGFHRAHQACFIDRVLAVPGQSGWGICAAGIREQDRPLQEAMQEQDFLYTLVEQSEEASTPRIVGSITGYLLGQDRPDMLEAKMADPETKIISLTVTTPGYYIDQKTQELDFSLPDIKHDLERPQETPLTIFGYLCRAFRKREKAGAPCTIMSCDNFPGNGDLARRTLAAFAGAADPRLAKWIEANITAPNSMVDRITPVPNEETRESVRRRFAIDDRCPVICEPFIQWVLEDQFAAGRPALQEVGVQLTSDVAPYEKIKLRILNAGHSLICYLGYLAGHRYIYEIVRDPLFEAYMRAYFTGEVAPLLAPVPGIDITEYQATVIARFKNPTIKDTALRICQRGSTKYPKFILPTIREQLARGGSIDNAALSLAGWIRFLQGTDEKGEKIPVEDPLAAELMERAKRGGADPRPVLKMREVFGNLADSPSFHEAVARHLGVICTKGTRAALQLAAG